MLKKQTVWLLTMLSLMIVLSVYYMMIDKDDQQAFIDADSPENSATSGATDDNDGNNDGDKNDQGMVNDDNDSNNNSEKQGVTENKGNDDEDNSDQKMANDDSDGNDNANDQGITEDNDNNDEQENAPDISDFTNLGKDELFTMNRMEIQNKRSKKVGYLEDIVASANATTDEKNDALDDIYKIDEAKTKEYILQNTIMSKADTYQDVLVRSEDEMIYVHVMTDELSKEEAIDIMQLVRDEFGEVPVDVKYN